MKDRISVAQRPNAAPRRSKHERLLGMRISQNLFQGTVFLCAALEQHRFATIPSSLRYDLALFGREFPILLTPGPQICDHLRFGFGPQFLLERLSKLPQQLRRWLPKHFP